VVDQPGAPGEMITKNEPGTMRYMRYRRKTSLQSAGENNKKRVGMWLTLWRLHTARPGHDKAMRLKSIKSLCAGCDNYIYSCANEVLLLRRSKVKEENKMVMNHKEKEHLLKQYYPNTKMSHPYPGALLMSGIKSEILFAGGSEAIVRWNSSSPAAQKAAHFQLNEDADIIKVLEEFERREK
jgi:hypothetical protein